MKTCKECGKQKDLSEFYNHPGTKDKKLARCKECIKKGRQTEREKELARIIDKKRGKKQKRKQQKRKTLIKFRKENPEKWKAQQEVANFLRYHKEMKPKASAVSGERGMIHLHHPKYTKPNEVIPCTPREHKAFHNGELEEKEEYIIKLPF